MKDYAAMSDFEINSAVSMALLDKSANPSARYVAIGNYCNNPADAWPIIVEYGIGIIPYKNGLSEAWNVSRGLIEGTTKDKNPLRCAMIVFLMMKDGDNA